MENPDKPYVQELEHVKVGRFECTITRTYLGIREKETEALKVVQAIPRKKVKSENSESA